MLTKRQYTGIVAYYTVDFSRWLAARGYSAGDIQARTASVNPSGGTLQVVQLDFSDAIVEIWLENPEPGEEYVVTVMITLPVPGVGVDAPKGVYQFRVQGYV